MKISLNGYGENTATFYVNESVTAGAPVCMEDNFTVKTCSTDDNFIGVVINSKDHYACVQLDGYATFCYTGSAPNPGICSLVADGNGGVRVSDTGRQFIVTDVDTDKSTVGIIL